MSYYSHAEIRSLLDLSARIGENPLLTQASTGNTSIKLDETLWIKGSGKWLAAARTEPILIPLDLRAQPAEDSGASVETPMHMAMPHRVVVHVHSVNAIAWAVRKDAVEQLTNLLSGLAWQWIPFVQSGLPLACAVDKAMRERPGTNILVLGNHGLVVAGDNCRDVEGLLNQVERRLEIAPRMSPEPDYGVLVQVGASAGWTLPDEPELHALGADEHSRRLLGGGLLYPCQAIFSNASPDLYHSIRAGDIPYRRSESPFVIVEDAGTLLGTSLTPCEHAMLRGLAEVVQRIPVNAPIRYLSDVEIENGFNLDAYRYRELANAGSV